MSPVNSRPPATRPRRRTSLTAGKNRVLPLLNRLPAAKNYVESKRYDNIAETAGSGISGARQRNGSGICGAGITLPNSALEAILLINIIT
jgi:hypothetical protein